MRIVPIIKGIVTLLLFVGGLTILSSICGAQELSGQIDSPAALPERDRKLMSDDSASILGTAISINYPGIGIRTMCAKRTSLEIKYQQLGKQIVAGARTYFYYGNPSRSVKATIRLFWGLEGDYISFKGHYAKGAGYALGGFGGTEVFFSRRVSLSADIGPAFIYLRDRSTALDVSGVQFVLNSAFSVYF